MHIGVIMNRSSECYCYCIYRWPVFGEYLRNNVTQCVGKRGGVSWLVKPWHTNDRNLMSLCRCVASFCLRRRKNCRKIALHVVVIESLVVADGLVTWRASRVIGWLQLYVTYEARWCRDDDDDGDDVSSCSRVSVCMCLLDWWQRKLPACCTRRKPG